MLASRPLELSTPSDTEVRVVRHFGAPRALVFEAFTSPELIRRWMLGPDGWSMPVCEVDLRPGGQYRHVWRKEGEPELGVTGTFLEVEAPHRMVVREKFDLEGPDGAGSLVTTEFEALPDGDTRVRMTIVYPNREARDAAVRTGMAEGMEAGYQRLDGILAK